MTSSNIGEHSTPRILRFFGPDPGGGGEVAGGVAGWRRRFEERIRCSMEVCAKLSANSRRE